MAAPSIQPDRPPTLRLTFLRDVQSSRAATSIIRGFLTEQGLAADELFACELCLAEACNNAVEYADGPGRDLQPAVDAICNPEDVEFRVIDHTQGFELPEHINTPSPFGERGRGLFIIQSMMDEVHYLRGSDRNILIMRKKRRTPRAVPSSAGNTSIEELRRQLAESKRTVTGMARELCFRSETLTAVFRCAAELGNLRDVQGFEDRVLRDLLHLTNSEWYVLRLLTPERTLRLAATSDPALDLKPLPVGGTETTVESAVATNLTAETYDARECPNRQEPLLALGAESHGLVYPLCFGDTLVGTLTVGRTSGVFSYGERQHEVVRTFAEFLAIQTVSLRHREEELRNRIVARELEIAQDIQRSLLPLSLPQMPGFGLAGGWQSAREVGGDFYDAMALSDRTLLLVVADVMGKGVPAALFATNMRGLLRGLSERTADPAQLLSRVNRLVYAELSKMNMFITSLVVVVDLISRQVTAASAGHCPLLYVPHGRRTIMPLANQGLPLGVLPDTLYHNKTVTLGHPGVLLLHTDGLTEARNPNGEMFGQARLMEWLHVNAVAGRTADELRIRLAADLNRFRGSAAMADDQAFLLLAEQGVPVTAPQAETPWWRWAPTPRRSLLLPAAG